MDHASAASYLLTARGTGPGPDFPPALAPATAEDAYAIQRLVVAETGPVGGWKVGATGPEAPPSCAPMPAAGLHHAPATLPGDAFTTRDIESEIAFVMANDLPARATPYTAAEVQAAIATCHPGIEVLQSRFTNPLAATPLSNLADLIRHGAYILGAAIPNWQSIDFAQVQVVQTIDGTTMTRRGNPAGDMLRLVTWLANTGAVWDGGLRTGQIVTCGSWTGATAAPEHAHVTATFDDAEMVVVSFS
jgi:2-keto-4-pentenoate hydratase